MKAKYLVIGLALVSVLGACSRDEESLFDKSAAERSQEALDNANAVFPGAVNGWEMLYFANTESRGYNVLVQFNANGRVVATAKNSATTGNAIVTDSTSTWQVKLDYGPILTFDTYNDVLHAWADPRNDGDGLLGDYEFLILKATPEFIKLKGKKHSSYCYLYPLKEPVEAANYFAEVEAMQKALFDQGNLLHFKTTSGEFLLHDGSEGIFSLTALGEVPDEEALEIYPFATRRNNLQFMVSAREGDLSLELKGSSLAGETSQIFASSPITYFTEYAQICSGAWKIDIADINDSTKNAIAVMDEALKAKYTKNKKKASVQGLRFKKVDGNVVLVFSYIGNSTKANDIDFDFEIAEQNGSLKLTYQKPTNTAAENVVTAFPMVEDLLKTLNGVYAIQTDNALNPTTGMRLIENSNSAVWFNLTGNVE